MILSNGNPCSIVGMLLRTNVHMYLHPVTSNNAMLNVTNRPPPRAIGNVIRNISSDVENWGGVNCHIPHAPTPIFNATYNVIKPILEP